MSVFRSIIYFWKPPPFDDLEDQRTADYLHQSVVFSTIITLTILALQIFSPNTPSAIITLCVAVLLNNFILHRLIEKGKFTAVGITLAAGAWITTTIAAFVYRGVYEPLIVIYLVITIFLGYLISWRASLFAAIGSALVLLLLTALESSGMFVSTYEGNLWYDASISIIGIAAALTIIRFGTNRINSAIVAAQAKNEALLQATIVADAANAAKSEFLANMSHEIRTPLNAIIGLTSLMLDTPLNEEQQDFLNTMRISGDGLLSVINDILDFSKIEAGKLELEQQPFDLRQCVIEAVDLLSTKAAQKNLIIKQNVSDSVPAFILGDVTGTRQILVNLLGNAVKFTESGDITVSITGRKIRHGRFKIKFAVTDTGIGIPPERMDRLFLSFSQGDSSTTKRFGGTGLGLAISKNLAEAMGGKMWVESQFDQGSTFFFTILTEETSPPIEQSTIDKPSQPTSNLNGHTPVLDMSLAERLPLRILLAEDNLINQKVGLRILERLGYRADVAGNGLEVLESLRRQPYDLVLMDVQMPEMDGIEATRQIHLEFEPDAQPLIIALTANAMDGDRERFLQAGMDDYVSKPVRIEALTAAFERNFTQSPPEIKNQLALTLSS